MKLSEIDFKALKLEQKVTGNHKLHIFTFKKGKKAVKEFIEHCNNRGFVPVNPHSLWNEKAKGTDVFSLGLFFNDIEIAHKIKVIEPEN